MKQILHIFVKDARHQWLEILISIAAIAALVLTCHYRWRIGAMPYGSNIGFLPFAGSVSDLPSLLVLVVPLSWWLLISPLVHAEKLVGDRQFWITRPYEWKKLLAAKVLFLVVSLYVPLLIAQCVMLAEAGFRPFPSFRGLLYDSFQLTCFLVLPLVALATVTRNFARMTLAVLGAVVCLIAIVLLTAYAPPDRIAIPHQGEMIVFLAFGLCLAVVIVQYWRRSVRVSWVLLASLVVLFGAFNMGGAPDNALMDRNYPPSQRSIAAAQFTYQEKEGSEASALVAQRRDRVGISMPVLVSGMPDGTVTIPDFMKVTLQTPAGARWTSVWQSISMNKFFPGERVVANAQFTMPRAVYDEFIGKPLSVQITFALTQARAENKEQFTLGQDDFAVSGVGICTPITGFAARPDEIGGVACRAPLRHPGLTLVSSAWSAAPCSGTSTKTDDNVQTAAWIGSLEKESAELGIVPIWLASINFTNQFVMENNRPAKVRHFCSGTPLTFTRYTLTGRTQATFWMNGFQLPRLNAGQVTVINND
ncbi:MAG: hypothetical protein WA815_10695 [Terracidiphilus sp.]